MMGLPVTGRSKTSLDKTNPPRSSHIVVGQRRGGSGTCQCSVGYQTTTRQGPGSAAVSVAKLLPTPSAKPAKSIAYDLDRARFGLG